MPPGQDHVGIRSVAVERRKSCSWPPSRARPALPGAAERASRLPGWPDASDVVPRSATTRAATVTAVDFRSHRFRRLSIRLRSFLSDRSPRGMAASCKWARVVGRGRCAAPGRSRPAEAGNRVAGDRNLIRSLWTQMGSAWRSQSSGDSLRRTRSPRPPTPSSRSSCLPSAMARRRLSGSRTTSADHCDERVPDSDQSVSAWTAPGIVLEPSQAADLVLALTTTDPTGPRPSSPASSPPSTSEFAARSAEMALELITRGRVLPALEFTDGRLAGSLASADRRA